VERALWESVWRQALAESLAPWLAGMCLSFQLGTDTSILLPGNSDLTARLPEPSKGVAVKMADKLVASTTSQDYFLSHFTVV